MTGFLLDQFEILADAPGGVKQLRELILQLAVTGRLGTGDETDEPANISLENIKSEIEYLKQAGYARKRSSSSSESFIDDTKLPKNWVWTSLAELTHNWGQKVPNTDFVYIDVSSIDNQKGKINTDLNIISAKEAPSRARKLVKIGTVIFSTVRPYLKNCAIIEEEYHHETIVSTAFAILHPYSCLSSRFLLYYLRSSIFIRYTEGKMLGMAYPAINDAKLMIGPIPLPPLAEQQRIVQKVDSFMALCDDLEAKQTQKHTYLVKLGTGSLNALQQSTTEEELHRWWGHLQTNFGLIFDCVENVEALRQTILQLAVTGRLGTGDERDEDASILLDKIMQYRDNSNNGKISKSAKISHNDIIFSYRPPKKWILCTLSDIYDIRDGTHDTPHYYSKGIPFVTSKNIYGGKLDLLNLDYISQEDHYNISKRSKVERNDILFGNYGGSIGNVVLVDTDAEFSIKNLALFKYYSQSLCCPKYLYFFLRFIGKSLKENSSGGAQSFLSLKELRTHWFLLPPLAEQNRIVKVVGTLVDLCDQLEQKVEYRSNKAISLTNAKIQQITKMI